MLDINHTTLLGGLIMAMTCSSGFAAVGTHPNIHDVIVPIEVGFNLGTGNDIEDVTMKGRPDYDLNFQISAEQLPQCDAMSIDTGSIRLTHGALDFISERIGCDEVSETVTVMILADGFNDLSNPASFLLPPTSPSIQFYSASYRTLHAAGVIDELSNGGTSAVIEVGSWPTIAEIMENINNDRQFAVRFVSFSAILNPIGNNGTQINLPPVDMTQIAFQPELPRAASLLAMMGGTRIQATRQSSAAPGQ